MAGVAGGGGKGAGVLLGCPVAVVEDVGAGAPAGADATAPAGVGVCGGAGVAGVEGGLAAAAAASSGFGFSLVTRKLNLAPEPLGSHSMKLYEGK